MCLPSSKRRLQIPPLNGRLNFQQPLLGLLHRIEFPRRQHQEIALRFPDLLHNGLVRILSQGLIQICRLRPSNGLRINFFFRLLFCVGIRGFGEFGLLLRSGLLLARGALLGALPHLPLLDGIVDLVEGAVDELLARGDELGGGFRGEFGGGLPILGMKEGVVIVVYLLSLSVTICL